MTRAGRYARKDSRGARRRGREGALAAFALVVWGTAAADAQPAAATPQDNGRADVSPGEPGFATGLFASSRNNLLGDIWGLRTLAGTAGITLGVQETSEDLGNVTGGIHRGFDYDGLTNLSLGIDTQRAFGWPGGIFNVSAEQIHGRSLSQDNLDNLQTVSGIEATRSTRLWEIWYQQAVLDDRLDVKIGQQSLDQEFMVSSYSGLYLNTMMGWPLIPSFDMYAGGPAYPLSSLGVRLRVQPIPNVTVLAGVFDDNPAGGPFDDDSQVRGAEQSGTAFNLNTGALWIGEVQWAVNQPTNGEMVTSDAPAPGLPGTYKLGAWWDTAGVPDQRFDVRGLSLANPASDGIAGQDKGNWSLYAVGDQTVWRPDPQSPRSLGVFGRVMAAPADRNLITFSANGGMNIKALFPSRPGDTFGLGFGVGQVSRAAAGLDGDNAAVNGAGNPIRNVETFLEATYQYQVAPWWSVQPDAQLVLHPGAGIADPSDAGHEVGDELVLGVRTAITF